ncbi:Outer membrane protein assembly factor BamB [Planctomycetes bacterium Poly30]|uniref:Outer membrane protein assembly factor BamB n=1 Tax=Saltatorellus ferox TaxID=2528018 RepID=A0A518EY30_9BACT|nr:Outer membrane protein assembly factor BamB [Planctomycetes bacterium Poly30]
MTQHLLFAGTHGHVVAIDKRDGQKVWDTSLPRTGYSVVSILLEDGLLFCASGGRTFALDPEDGRIMWQNEMPGLGKGLVYLATERSCQQGGMMTLAEQATSDAAAAVAAS